MPAGIRDIAGYSQPGTPGVTVPFPSPVPMLPGLVGVSLGTEAAGISEFSYLCVYWHIGTATSFVTSAWAQRGPSNAAFGDSSGAELRHSPREWLPTGTSQP